MAGVGGTEATPAQGAPAQPPAGGQGQPTGAGKGDGQQGQQSQFNWELFPDVPEDRRELLEPHLKNVQGHVTKMEQQYAPYKSLMDFVSADQVSPLMGFLEAYQGDPVGTLIGMAQDLQNNGAIPPTSDMAALEALIRGQQQQEQVQPGQPGEEIPPWAQEMKSALDQQRAQAQQQEQAEAQAREEAEGEQILSQAKANIREQLTQAGISEDLVEDPMIVAAIIASDGDEQAAAQALLGTRDKFLAAFAQQNGGGPKPPDVKGQLTQPQKPQRRGDGYDEARQGAAQFLAQRQREEAQQ